ncbi:hypothetical protein [Nocardioides sp.]|uniref:hypothetical protein n=1 Tax=Nocardioides sp. TaxID=35761 RepID=UPI001A1EE520|nr:hypothetical protein [Nocardioides sp.]MBJ7358100.1 hypothetical protein [Nocardioides sp.]
MTTPGLPAALQALDQSLDAPRRTGIPLGNWRWLVRQRLGVVRDELLGERAGSQDGWLAARGGAAFRERNALLSRLTELSSQVLEAPDIEATRIELKRLVADVNRHLQRLNDISYDEVEMEIGGSE